MKNTGTQAYSPATDASQLKDLVRASGAPTINETFGKLRKVNIPLKNFVINMVDAGAAGTQGFQKLFTFPEGVVHILGAVENFTIQKGTGGLVAGAAVVVAIGSAQVSAADATLTTTEADIIASFAATLTAGVGAAAKHGSLVAAAFDGHTTPQPVFLNFAAPDADSTANDTLTLNGSITIFFFLLGDY